jgi:hypothetical protein
MSKLTLNAMITKAMLDEAFQADILNGKRQECIEKFELSDEEKKALLVIDADNLEQFVSQVERWMHSDDRIQMPPI